MKNNWVIIMGSHRKNGFSGKYTETIKENLENGGANVQLFDINALHINPCIDCNYCKNNYGLCVHNDDMKAVYEALRTAENLIVVAPVYFANVPSKLKALIDRIQMLFICDFTHKTPYVSNVDKNEKNAYIVSFGGAREYDNQFLGVELTLDMVFRNLRMNKSETVYISGTDHLNNEDGILALKAMAVEHAKKWGRRCMNE